MIHGSSASGQASAANLTIRVSAGSGKGRTKMAAFDSALRNAGVADHNLVRLSSVIPAGSVVLPGLPVRAVTGLVR